MKNLVAILLIASLFSCATRKEKAFNYYQKNKGELAQLCNDEFPFKEEYIPGIPEVKTDTIYSNEVVEIPCPEPTPEIPRPSVKCPPQKTIVQETVVRDTIKVESTRHIKALNFEIATLKESLASCTDSLAKSEKQNKTYSNWLMIVAIVFGVYIISKLSKFFL